MRFQDSGPRLANMNASAQCKAIQKSVSSKVSAAKFHGLQIANGQLGQTIDRANAWVAFEKMKKRKTNQPGAHRSSQRLTFTGLNEKSLHFFGG